MTLPQKIISKTVERKKREKAARREGILNATQKLFRDEGVANLTMQDIARANEYSIGTLYLYFKSKDDIYAALAARGCRLIDTKLSELVAEEGRPARPQVVDFLRHALSTLQEYSGYFDLLSALSRGGVQPEISQENLLDLLSVTSSSLEKAGDLLRRSNPSLALQPDQLADRVLLLWAQLLGVAQIFGTERSTLFSTHSCDSLIELMADLIMIPEHKN